MDSIGRSLRPPLACASPAAAINTVRAATARRAGCGRLCLYSGFTQRDVMHVPTRSGQRQPVVTYNSERNAIRPELPTWNYANAHGSGSRAAPLSANRQRYFAAWPPFAPPTKTPAAFSIGLMG